MKIHNQSFKESTITAAFKTTGIYPFNCDCLSEKTYIPSYNSSTHAHVPPSYSLLPDGTQTQWTYNNSDDDSDSDSGDDNDDTNPSHQPQPPAVASTSAAVNPLISSDISNQLPHPAPYYSQQHTVSIPPTGMVTSLAAPVSLADSDLGTQIEY
jgi:hypothetical protein